MMKRIITLLVTAGILIISYLLYAVWDGYAIRTIPANKITPTFNVLTAGWVWYHHYPVKRNNYYVALYLDNQSEYIVRKIKVNIELRWCEEEEDCKNNITSTDPSNLISSLRNVPCVTAGESDEIRVLKNDGVKIASTGVLLTETQYCVVHIGEENLKKDIDELCEKFSQEYLAPSWLKGQVFAPWEASCSLGRYSVLNAELAQLKGHRLPIHMLVVATEFGGKVWSIVSSPFRRLNI